jgi:hypothetical protein
VRPADLPGLVHAPTHHPLDHGGQIGVVEDDGSRLPPELERDPLHLFTAELHDSPTGCRRPGERHLVRAGMGHEVFADRAVAGHDAAAQRPG